MPPVSPFVVVVSGVPRSGTSLMMQMLHRGGLPVLADGVRQANEDNPLGYMEFERVKSLRTDKQWLDDAKGKAVKIIHMLVPELPDDRVYRVVFMRRDLNSVVRSQAKMLERSGKRGGALSTQQLIAIYQSQLQQVQRWMDAKPRMLRLDVDYEALVESPREQAKRVSEFLGMRLNMDEMVKAVDPSLQRNHSTV